MGSNKQPTKTTKLRHFFINLSLLLLMLVTLYVVIARQAIAWITDYKQTIEKQLVETLKTPVSIGNLQGNWNILSPKIIISDIHIGNQQQKLLLRKLTINVDILDSIWNWQLRVNSIYGDELNLQIRENQPDIWSIGGIPRQKDPITPEIVLTQLQRFNKISIRNSTISVHPYNLPPVTFSKTQATLTHFSDEKMRLDAILDIAENKPLILSAQADIAPKHWDKMKGSLYANIPYLNWKDWYPYELPITPWNITNLSVGGELWLSLKQGELNSLVLKTNNNQATVQYQKNKPVTFKNLATTLWFKAYENKQILQAVGFNADINDIALTPLNLRVDKVSTDNQDNWHLQANTLQIDKITPSTLLLAPIPDHIIEIIKQVAPQGTINNLKLTWQPHQPLLESLNFAADLDKVTFNPYQESVGASNVTGSLQGGINKGQLLVNTHDFSLFINSLYNKAWHYKTANANLNWSFDGDKISIFSPLMRLTGEEGNLSGDMMIRLYPYDTTQDYMDLRVNIANTDASYVPKYIPTHGDVPADLIKWLNTAIKKGTIETASFQYQGSISKHTHPLAHSLLVYAKVNDATVNYQAPWAPAEKINGEVFVDPLGVKILAESGSIGNAQLKDIVIDIPHVDSKATSILTLTANIRSDLTDILRTLKSAPYEISHVFSAWQGKGLIKGNLALTIPLKKGVEPLVITHFSTSNAQLALQPPIPPLTNIKGSFRYDSKRGLSSPNVSAQLFGEPVNGTITAKGIQKPISYFKMNGIADTTKLIHWLTKNKSTWPISGKTPYNLELSIGEQDQLHLNSTMKGINIDLPSPFNKQANETKPLSLQVKLQPQKDTTLKLDYGSLISAAIITNDKLADWKGELFLNQGKASFSDKQGLQVKANFDLINLEEWYKTYEHYIAPLALTSTTANTSYTINEIRSINITTGQISGFNIPPQQAAIYIQPAGEQGWRFNIRTPYLMGRMTAPQTKALPYYVFLDYLKIPNSIVEKAMNDNSDQHDFMKSFDTKAIPNVNVTIKDLYLGDDLLGSINFKNNAHQQGLNISGIHLNLKGVKIRGDLDWQIGKQTTFNGKLFGKDLEQVQKNWHLKPSIAANSFSLIINGTWKGSPADFSSEHFTGVLIPELKDGRILTIDQSASSILRILGIFNLEAISKQLRLDFSSIYKPGLAFDSFTGELVSKDTILTIHKPLVFSGPSMLISLTGDANLKTHQINGHLKVGIPIASSISIASLAVMPPVGGAMLVADYFLGNQLMKLIAINYRVTGNWNDPKITLGN